MACQTVVFGVASPSWKAQTIMSKVRGPFTMEIRSKLRSVVEHAGGTAATRSRSASSLSAQLAHKIVAPALVLASLGAIGAASAHHPSATRVAVHQTAALTACVRMPWMYVVRNQMPWMYTARNQMPWMYTVKTHMPWMYTVRVGHPANPRAACAGTSHRLAA